MTFFPTLPSRNENSERELNPMPHPLYLYFSRPAFFVSCADLDERLPNVKYVFKLLNFGFSVKEIYRFITWDRGIIFY